MQPVKTVNATKANAPIRANIFAKSSPRQPPLVLVLNAKAVPQAI
jgi:hypothetical protein